MSTKTRSYLYFKVVGRVVLDRAIGEMRAAGGVQVDSAAGGPLWVIGRVSYDVAIDDGWASSANSDPTTIVGGVSRDDTAGDCGACLAYVERPAPVELCYGVCISGSSSDHQILDHRPGTFIVMEVEHGTTVLGINNRRGWRSLDRDGLATGIKAVFVVCAGCDDDRLRAREATLDVVQDRAVHEEAARAGAALTRRSQGTKEYGP